MAKENGKTKVLVTGASGYIATHCVQQLLDEGYSVRGTVRSLKNADKIKPLRDLTYANERLELVEADLMDLPEKWTNVIKDCNFVLHVASPFPLVDDHTIVQIAVDGTLTVLKACAKCPSVKKVVLTSSCAAVNEGHEDEDRVFSEDDWTNLESNKVLYYAQSKTAAEKAAWDFVKENKEHQFKMTALNPTFVIGPLLMDTPGTSITTVKKFLNFEVPAIPPLQMGMVDVRDTAKAHILAMKTPESDGERILITEQPSVSFRKMCEILSDEFRSQGYYIPFIQAPYSFVWLYSFISVEARASLGRLNRKILFNNEKSKKLLNLEYRPVKDSIIEMGYSLIERGIVPKKWGYTGPSKLTN